MMKGSYKGDYKAPKHSSSLGGSHMSDDSAGVEDGLSARSGFNSDGDGVANFSVNNEVDSVTGNPRQAIKPRSGKSSTEKGKKFEIC